MLRTVAIDDEPLALQLVVNYIKQTPFLDLKGSFTNPLEALSFLQENEVDFVLLDIRMPDLSGTKLAALLKDGLEWSLLLLIKTMLSRVINWMSLTI